MSARVLLAVTIAALGGTYAATLPANDPDLFWHLASGEWMLDHRQLLTTDVFSYTMAGTPYSAGQWLGEIVYALVYRAAGWTGIDLMRGLLVGASAFFTARLTLRAQPQAAWAAPASIGALLVSTLMWGDRPQLFSLALFPVFLDVLLAARSGGDARGVWVLVPLSLLWAWLHGAFVLGLAVMGITSLEAWVSGSDRRRVIGAAFLLSLVASQLTPAGPFAFLSAASYAGSASAVAEEKPATIASGAGLVFFLLLFVVVAAALLSDRGELRRRLGSPLLFALLIPAVSIIGLLHLRNLPYAAVVLAPAAAALVPLALGRPTIAAPVVRAVVGAAVAAAILAVAAVTASVAAPRSPDLSSYPVGAIPVLRDRPGNLFNEYDWGGYLIFALPEHPTYVDGRGAALFPSALIREFQDTVALRPGYREILAARDVRYLLVRPDRALAVALEEDGWPVLERADGWVLLERP